jgi:hypothetical protein
MRFSFGNERFPVQFKTFLDKYIRNAVSILGNGSRRDSAMGVTANCIKNQKHSKNRSARLPIFTCGCVTKLVQLGGEIAELVSDNRLFCKHSDIKF